MPRRASRKVLALVALTIAVVSWRTARAEAETGAQLHHRVAGTTWLAVGGPPTIGVELSGAHRVVARGIPVWLTYGGALAHQNFACDSGDACDSHERDLHAGAGFIGCTSGSGLCGGAALTLAWRHTQEASEMPDPAENDLAPQLRLHAEAGGLVRFRIGVRLETLTPRLFGDECRSDCPVARAAADVGLVTAW